MKKCKECGGEEWGFLSVLNADGYCPTCAFKHNQDKIKRLQEQIKKLKYYRDRAHKALCEISSLSEKEMDSGKAWDIAHDAILCLNKISGV